jgi:hypothetical protein
MNTQNSFMNRDVSQDSVLGPLIYLLYTADLPTSTESITATFVDNTEVLATESEPMSRFKKTTNQPTCNPKLV